jgi:hypothetical protein
MNLTAIANLHGTDKGDEHHEKHNYTPVYEKYFESRRNTIVNLLEIGCNDPRFPGASLRVWNDYFTHPSTLIYGLDINPPMLRGNRIRLLTADQSKPFELLNVITYLSSFDFVIDDGLHTFECQINSFFTIFPLLAPQGVYFIEDCHAKDCGLTQQLFRTIRPGAMEIASITFECNDKLIVINKA